MLCDWALRFGGGRATQFNVYLEVAGALNGVIFGRQDPYGLERHLPPYVRLSLWIRGEEDKEMQRKKKVF